MLAGGRGEYTHRADLLAVGLLWGLCLLYLGRLLAPWPQLRLHVVEGDFTNQFYPFRHFAASEWRAGRVPLWNPDVLAGHPFLADVQTAVFYPLSLANALLGALAGLPLAALELEMAAHYPLAALFTYLLGRELLASRLGALVAATAFTFSGFLTSYPAQQLAMLESAVWLPLVLLCLERAARRPASRHRWRLAAGLAYGVALLAGHPQTVLFVGYTALAYLLYRSLGAGEAPLARRLADAAGGAAPFALAALGLAAVQLLPTAELLGLSNRASLAYEAAAYGYERRALLGILLPSWRGEKALYVGVLPLLLAALAVGRHLARWGLRPAAPTAGASGLPIPFFAGLALLAVPLSLGGKTPLFLLLYRFAPGFALFRDQERTIYLFAFAVSLLAGAGAAWLAGDPAPAAPGRGGWLARLATERAGLAALAGAAALGAGLLLELGRRAPATFDPQGNLAGALRYFLVVVLASLTLLWLRRWLAHRRLLGVLIVALVAADLFAVNLGNNLSPRDPDPGPRLAGLAERLQIAPGELRVRGESDALFPPNYGGVWGLPTTVGDTPFVVQRVAEFQAVPDGEWRRWQVLNVRYFLSVGPPFEGLELAFEHGDLKVYRMVFSLPRAWAVRDAQVAADPADALRRVLAPAYHPGDTVVLEEPPGVGPLVKGERPDVRIVSYSPQRVELAARADGPALLVLADTYYPGWQARRNGEPVRLLRANYVARALELPPGEHRFELWFDPLSFKVGAAVSVLTLLVSVLSLRRRR